MESVDGLAPIRLLCDCLPAGCQLEISVGFCTARASLLVGLHSFSRILRLFCTYISILCPPGGGTAHLHYLMPVLMASPSMKGSLAAANVFQCHYKIKI